MSKSAEGRLYVLDTSALLAFLKGEPGSDVVESILEDSVGVIVSLITLMEVRYLYLREAGKQATEDAFKLIEQIGLQEVEVSRNILEQAAQIKSRNHLSVADAIIAATAKEMGATLIHRDPEFEPLAGEIDLMALPMRDRGK